MSRDDLLLNLTALDFVLVDLALYLDTHTNDHEALAKYNETAMKADMLRKEYEKNYGPLYSYRSVNAGSWDWFDDPWPWHYCFNPDMPKGGCN